MNKPDTNEATREELIAYIAHQEAIIGGVPRLIAELRVSANIIAEDVKRANEGKEDGFILLDNGKNFQRILTMIKNIEFFERLESGQPPKPTKSKEIKTEETEQPKKKINIQDYVLKSVV